MSATALPLRGCCTSAAGDVSLQLHLLPEELLVKIFLRLGHPPRLACCTRLNRRLHDILSDDGLWKDIVAAAVDGKQPPRNGVPLGVEPQETYRKAYIRLMYDVSRLEISCAELIESTWNFYFVNDLYLFHASPEQAAQRAGSQGRCQYMANFSDTGFFTSNIAGAPSRRTPTRWQLLARSEIEHRAATDGLDGTSTGGSASGLHVGADLSSSAGQAAARSPGAGDEQEMAHDEKRECCAQAAEHRMQDKQGSVGEKAE